MNSEVKNLRIFEISSQDRSDVIKFPINPKTFEMSEAQLNQKITLLNIGEVTLKGNRGSLCGSLASFFPSPRSPFWSRADRTPQEYINTLIKLKNNDNPLRLIVSGSSINLAVIIDKISYTYNEGDDDIYFTIEFSEYRQLNVPTVAVKAASVQDSGLKSRPNTASKPKEVIVRSQADTLWAMACKYYGNGAQWTKIAKANNISDPRSLKLGQRVVLP